MFKRRYLKISCLFFVSVIFLCSLIINPTISHASGTPSHLSYQGKLTDTGGNPLGGGGTLYYFKFSLWDSSTPGTGNQVWPLTPPNPVSLTVKQGSFNVLIGDTDNGYPDTLDYDFNSNNPVYLQIEVSSDGDTYETLAPRSALSSTAFSKVSESVHGTSDSSFGTTTGFANTLVSMLSTAIDKAVLTIKGAAGQVANLFNILDSNDNSLFTVTASGNVGIGTTTPSSRLTISSGQISGPNGSVSAPAYSFNSDLDTGIYSSGANVLSLSTGGTQRFLVYAGAAESTGQLRALGTTAATPTFVGSNDTNTGLFIPGSDVLGFSTGGTERLRIDASGNVGIGATPAVKLQIDGGINNGIRLTYANGYPWDLSTYSDGSFNISDQYGNRYKFGSAAAPAGLTIVGSMGIGTTTPSAKLDVWGNLNVGTSSTPALFVNTATGKIGVGTNNPSDIVTVLNTNAFLTLNRNSASTGYAGIRLQSGVGIENWVIGTRDGDANGYYVRDSAGNIPIYANATKLGVNNTSPTYNLDVKGAAGLNPFNVASSTGTSLFSILSTGNIGVGVASPNEKFQVNGNIGTYGNGNGFVMYNLGQGNYSGNFEMARFMPVSNEFLFQTLQGGTGVGRNMRFAVGSAEMTLVNSSGYIGVGTTTPGSKLSVSGDFAFTGALKPNGDAGTTGYVLQTTGTTAQWVATSTLGISSNVNALSNILVGNLNSNTGTNAMAIGYSNNAATLNSVLVGNQNFTSTGGYSSVAVGILNNSTGVTLNTTTGVLTGTGSATSTVGVGSTALGILNNARGETSTALGYLNFASGLKAIAIGYNNKATSVTNTAMAIGDTNTASGALSVAIGSSNTTSNSWSFAFGASNNVSGASTSIGLGYGNTVSGDSALAVGRQNTSSGTNGITIGYNNIASANNTVAIGTTNFMQAASSIALGSGIQHSVANSISIGYNLTSAVTNTIQFGLNNTNKVIIDSNANLGIGTSTPSAKLDVWGNLNVATGTTPTLYVNTATNMVGVGSITSTSSINAALTVYGVAGIESAAASGQGNLNIYGKNSGTRNLAGSLVADSWTGGLQVNAQSGQLRLITSSTNNISFESGNGGTALGKWLGTGNLGVGTTTPIQKLSVVGNAQFTAVTSGAYGFDLNLTSDGTLTTAASDERLKKNIASLDASSTLEKLIGLRPVEFDWKSNSTHDIGLIAQEVEQIFPELVFTNPTDGYKGVNYSRIPVLLIGAVQELGKKVELMFAWFGENRFNIQGEICVDDVCVTKEQFKQILINGGGNKQNTDVSSQGNTSTTNQEENTSDNNSENSTSTPEISTETSSNSVENEGGTDTSQGVIENIPEVLDSIDLPSEPVVESASTVDSSGSSNSDTQESAPSL